ncbi:MAG: hypothetical protein RMH84_02785 [Sulfolobales archaeon]|nr:hypothetical protein [Sulfolobales archaeon]MDW8010501.1 hypothetical protein [Sulfolobales archaeon]
MSNSPRELGDVLLYYYERGARGFLVSGGFSREGYLPISREHVGVLREFRRGRYVYLSIHLGLAPRELVDEVLEVFDLVDYEVPPSPEFVRYGRGLSRSVDEYLELLDYVTREYGEDRIAPHVVLGSPLATLSQELEILEKVGSINRRLVVALLHANAEDLETSRVLANFQISRRLFNEVSLGCMRPRKSAEVVGKLVEYGCISRIVNPSRRLAEAYGMRVVSSCCSISKRAFELFEK